MLVVQTTDKCSAERSYIVGVLLGQFLGLKWRHEVAEFDDVRICLNDYVGEIRLPDIFFQRSAKDWLSKQSLPSLPLVNWDSRELGAGISLVNYMIPIIYGNGQPLAQVSQRCIELPIDIFGSAFFMLARHEEAVLADRDCHDRFPATASFAYRADFLSRPIVDEYVEILWACIQRLWPGLKRKARKARTLVSCDVDNPYEFYTKSWKSVIKRVGGDLLKRRNARTAIRNLENYIRSNAGDYSVDPLNTFDWIMDANEKSGNHVAFYFLVDNTVPQWDAHYSIDEPRIRALIRTIEERGHEVGLHGSYGSYRSRTQLTKEVDALKRVLVQAGIDEKSFGVRQHYLRWSCFETARSQDTAGIVYDTTLGYADHPGFRCGTCHEYTMYDVVRRSPLQLRQRPLNLMECSVINDRYLGLGYTNEALDMMQSLKRTCQLFDGDFTMLWHNSHFMFDKDREFYEFLIS